MGKRSNRVAIMGQGESSGEFDKITEMFRAKPQEPTPAKAGKGKKTKSASVLPNKAKPRKGLRQRIRSAFTIRTIQDEESADASADTSLGSADLESPNEAQKRAFSPYLMDLPLEELRTYRHKEGTYGPGKSVRGPKKGVREFGELLIDMCLEDIIAYHPEYKCKAVPFIVVTPCAEEEKPALLVSSLDILESC